ncbi:orotidine-5'-phosphate decarboxylase [Aerococcaceae bacterium zg-B36]|uniref:orotidine-5'-phosphate decarboxylase n=1 Tax=Aerococcaceae bacterium zg-252 TaxID=2796928 RepID=UPI001BD88ABF|nr:orotidine-5'-phosphate decarboxylase [Aerococcaceae bacterium zg-B36]
MLANSPIIALDFPNKEACLAFLSQFDNQALNIKVGMELYYQEGNALIEQLLSKGHKIFLDLKLHDIPNTVESAMRILASKGISMVTIHASGGSEMIRAAKRGLESGTIQGQPKPKLLAVTQLTSLSQEQLQDELLISVSLKESVLHYAQVAIKAGADGIVCSPLEAELLRKQIDDSIVIVTPGIRNTSYVMGSDDQTRVTTPYQAVLNGSDYIVVGRPITQASNPCVVYDAMKEEFNKGREELKWNKQ